MKWLLVLLLPSIALAAGDPIAITFPNFAGGQIQAVVSANTLLCGRFAAPATQTYTKIAGWIDIGVAASTTGFAIYDNGGTELGEAVGSSATNDTTVNATGQTIALTAGSLYWVCVCSTSTSVQYEAASDGGTGASRLMGMMNGVNTNYGTSTGCTTGNPDASLGSVTPATNFRVPLVVLDQ